MSSSLREIRFDEQELPANKSISNIKYHYKDFWNNNLFYLFNDQLDYILANNFGKFRIKKNNVDRFRSNPLMVPLIEKPSYSNTDK